MLAIAYRFHYYQIDMSLGGEEGAVVGRGLLEVSMGGERREQGPPGGQSASTGRRGKARQPSSFRPLPPVERGLA